MRQSGPRKKLATGFNHKRKWGECSLIQDATPLKFVLLIDATWFVSFPLNNSRLRRTVLKHPDVDSIRSSVRNRTGGAIEGAGGPVGCRGSRSSPGRPLEYVRALRILGGGTPAAHQLDVPRVANTAVVNEGERRWII